MRGEVTRIGELIHARNVGKWEAWMEKTPGFLKRRVKDPRLWRLIDAHKFADLIGIEPEIGEELVNAEITYRESAGIRSAGDTPRASASR